MAPTTDTFMNWRATATTENNFINLKVGMNARLGPHQTKNIAGPLLHTRTCRSLRSAPCIYIYIYIYASLSLAQTFSWQRSALIGASALCHSGTHAHNLHTLGPAKTCILRGAPRTYAIKTRAVTDNLNNNA